MKFFDSHAHLCAHEYAKDIDEVIKRSQEAGVMHIATCTDSLEDFRANIELKKKYPDYFVLCLGLHPEIASAGEEYFQKGLRAMEENISLMGAVGEVGLDYHYDDVDENHALQKRLFELMCIFANEHDLPLIVHCREAEEDCFKILAKHRVKRVDMHCYAGDVGFANRLRSLGIDVRFGFNGILTFKKASDRKEVVAQLPLGMMMLETDSPVLAPVPYRGRRNEPAYITKVLDAMIKVRGEDAEYTASVLYNATMDFYGLKD